MGFWNSEVLENIDGVAEVIARSLSSMAPFPLPWPLPPGEGNWGGQLFGVGWRNVGGNQAP